MPAEGFEGHMATDGSFLGEVGKWRACGWAVVQLVYDEEMGPLHGMARWRQRMRSSDGLLTGWTAGLGPLSLGPFRLSKLVMPPFRSEWPPLGGPGGSTLRCGSQISTPFLV